MSAYPRRVGCNQILTKRNTDGVRFDTFATRDEAAAHAHALQQGDSWFTDPELAFRRTTCLIGENKRTSHQRKNCTCSSLSFFRSTDAVIRVPIIRFDHTVVVSAERASNSDVPESD
jgi:hypothetical protein